MAGASRTLDVPGFQTVRFLGSGARSSIWQIRKRQTGEMFALKRVVKRAGSDDRFFNQAYNEFEVGRQFDHSVVRHIYRLRRVRHFLRVREVQLVMEYCEGTTLQESRPQSMTAIVQIFEQVAQGIRHINGRGFVHSDTKPNNILVSDDGVVKLIDLGQSCRLGMIKDRIQGTPDYIAPEQVQRRPLDARTDVYNFGATLYWVVTGKPIPTLLPKEGSVVFKNDLRITPPEQINPAAPAPLSKMILDCIEILPSRRPQNMQAVLARLELCEHTLTKSQAGSV